MSKIINGKEIAQELKDSLKANITNLKNDGVNCTLAVIQVGTNPASCVYVNNKKKACAYIGIESVAYELPEETTETELLSIIDKLNKDDNVNGILCQLPLPKHINEDNIIAAIAPEKDVDGFHPTNVAKLWLNDNTAMLPCTPAGIIYMLEHEHVELSGKTAVVIGRSNIVGKPIAKLLMDKGVTVTICHSKTPQDIIEKLCKECDIIVAAVGKPNFVKWCNTHSTIIDVGINRTEDGKLCGDVDPVVYTYAEKYTPVPGGVGPMTIAMLMQNCLAAMQLQKIKKIIV